MVLYVYCCGCRCGVYTVHNSTPWSHTIHNSQEALKKHFMLNVTNTIHYRVRLCAAVWLLLGLFDHLYVSATLNIWLSIQRMCFICDMHIHLKTLNIECRMHNYKRICICILCVGHTNM